jgi:hypothetical protein
LTSGVREVEVLTFYEDSGRTAEARFKLDSGWIMDD